MSPTNSTRWAPSLACCVSFLLCILILCDPASAAAGEEEELTRLNWNSTLLSRPPGTPALIEFFANWCPYCRAFAPTWAKVAAFFNQSYPEENLLVAKLDCGTSPGICALANVSGYPRIMFAHDAKSFATFDNSSIIRLTSRSTSDMKPAEIVEWVGQQMQRNFTWKEPKVANRTDYITPAEPPLLPPWSMADIESAAVELFQIITDNPANLEGAENRQFLLDILKFWSVASPSKQCKSGAAQIMSNLEKLWPSSASKATPELANAKPCGNVSIIWRTCASPVPAARGFSCGMWVTFHVSSERLQKLKEPGREMLTFLKAFNNFFPCTVCQTHFAEVLAEAPVMKTGKEVSLWLWEAHNEVNQRLSREETRRGFLTSGDPDFPKVQWPTKTACPACWSTIAGQEHFNEKAIYPFLKRVYSPKGDNNTDIYITANDLSSKAAGLTSARKMLLRAVF